MYFFFLKTNGESKQMSFSKMNAILLVYETLFFPTIFQNILCHLHYHGYRRREKVSVVFQSLIAKV